MYGAELRLKRMTLGISVHEFAERAGVDRRTLQRWETDDREITPDAAALIDRLWQQRLDKIDKVLAYCERMEEEHGSVDAVTLDLYVTGQAHYRADPEQTWAEHTAQLGAIYTALELADFPVNVVYAPDEP